ncbi:MAG: ABC transporter ATP-binding protein/permease [Acetatifactor sp.]|nr:ABC transporter ATP-binding protein/permease [Acetatifactor sp.]
MDINTAKTGSLRWILGLLGKRLPLYLGAIVISALAQSGTRIANALIVKQIITAAQTGQISGVHLAVLGSFMLFVLCQMLWKFSIARYNTEGAKGVASLGKLVFSKVLRLPYAYYEEHHSGDFMSKLIFDTERVGDIYSSRLRRLATAILSSIAFLIPMLYYSAHLTFCLLALSMLAFLANSLLAGPMKRAGKALSQSVGALTEKLTNLLSGMEIVKLLPAKAELLADYRQANGRLFQVQQKSNLYTAVTEGLNNFFDLAGALAFLGLGVWFVSRGLVSLGGLAAVYTLYGSFRYQFLDIGKYFPQMMHCIANVERLREFLLQEEADLEPAYVHDKDLSAPAVSVEHVSFSYANGANGRPILTDVSLEVQKGICVAITGESGCGKSTLAKLLLGFYRPASGTIRVDGPIAYVPQEPYLYQLSIAENIAWGKGNAESGEVSREEIIQAARIANAHDFIMKLPEGYDTIVGERGNTLSGGERQRIAIARAVLMNAPILLLDEATSALDSESEKLVNEAIRRVSQNCTTIMIAHRESTIAMADRVIRL